MSRLRKRPGVEADVAEIAEYFLQESEATALRFIDAVQQTLKWLADRPGVGSPKRFRDPLLEGGRSWWVRGFPNYLIFYLTLPPSDDDSAGIDVLLISHGARDFERLLGQRARH